MNKEEKQFLSQAPETRAELLKKAIKDLKESAKKEQANFALLAYGSGIYGYNPENVGKLYDLDLLAISHREHSLLKILGSLRRMGIAVTDDLALISLSEKLRAGQIDFFRIKGTYQGIPTSVHLFAYDSLKGKHSPLLAFGKIYGGLTEHQAIAKKEQNKSRTEFSFDGVAHKIKYIFTGLINDLDPIRYESAISRKKTSDKNEVIPTVGVQAEKILDSKLLYEPKTDGEAEMNIEELLEKYWRTFIRSALFYQPQASDQEIINLLARSPRFSEEFRQELKKKIQAERDRLALQKS